MRQLNYLYLQSLKGKCSSLYLLPIVHMCTIGHGGQKDNASQGQITFILPVQNECVGVLRADEV